MSGPAGPPPVSGIGRSSLLGFDAIAAYLKARSGLTLGRDKLYLMESRLAGILRQHRLGDLRALAERLNNPGQDRLGREVVEAMTTNESLFFRDGRPFVHVRTQALPALVAARAPGQRLRIWSAASSSGQEAYSLAMILLEMRPLLGDRRVEIIGTDIARAPLARARAGLFSQFEVQRGLPVAMLMQHFTKEAAGWRISEQLRGMVEFREWNLLGNPRPLGWFDLIFCRNVLIYFEAATKAKVLHGLAGQLAPDGLLYLGSAETALGLTNRLVPFGDEVGVFKPA